MLEGAGWDTAKLFLLGRDLDLKIVESMAVRLHTPET